MQLPIKPMLAERSPAPDVASDHWPHPFNQSVGAYSFEVKYDGIRMIGVHSTTGRARLYSRQGNDITDQWPEVAGGLAACTDVGTILDGELIVQGDNGGSFYDLQNARRWAVRDRLRYRVFDILQASGADLQGASLSLRREALHEEVRKASPVIELGETYGDGREAWAAVQDRSLEGLIAKPFLSRYVQDNRGIWLKVKRNVVEQFEVVGYTSGEGSRSGLFGALVLARWDGIRLVYAGKAGTGFTQRVAAEVLAEMREHRTAEPPFDAGALVRAKAQIGRRQVTWIRPGRLRATIEYNDTTGADNLVRMGAFKGMESML